MLSLAIKKLPVNCFVVALFVNSGCYMQPFSYIINTYIEP